MLSSILTLSLAALASAAPIGLSTRQTTCYTGVYVIAARGTNEDAGYGSTKPVVDAVVSAIPGSGSVALDWPASALSPIYPISVSDGITALVGLVHDYVDTCGGKIVLIGFSQGGNVITDSLAGGVAKPDPLDPSYVEYISAITVFGDPAFTHGQSFDVGTDTTTDGIFSRGGDSLALLNTYASKIQSYCDNGDVFCASGDDKDVHGEEVPRWGSAAATFIIASST